jgi:hypothetical protein
MKNHWLVLFLASALTVGAQQKDGPRFYIVKDSTYTLWSGLPNSVCDPDWEKYMIDAAGDLFKLPTKYPDINRPMKLTPSGWKTWDKGMGPENITSLETDGRGLIFARSREHLYLLQDTVWKTLPTSKYGYPPVACADGGLYRLCDEKGGDNTYYADRKQIMRWSENGYQPCGANGKPLFLKHKSDRFMVDRKGQIYSYEDHEYGQPKTPIEIYIYTGGEWKTIGTMPADLTFFGFDMNNHLYVNGWDDQHNSYFKKWDGQAWTDIEVPKGVELKSGFLFDEALNVYIEGTYKSQDMLHDERVVFRHTDAGWKEVARSDKGQWIDKFIPTTGDIYAVVYKDKMIHKFSGRWIVRQMEIADIPVDPKAKANPDFKYVQKDIGLIKLFREDGKLGVQNMDGRILVHSVFEKVLVVKTPAHLLAVGEEEQLTGTNNTFCLQMIRGNDTVFAAIGPLAYGTPFPFQLKAFRKRVARTCGTCGGDGQMPEREIKVPVRGEYVEEKTSYSTLGENVWYPSCNCYVYTTTRIIRTTSGGYYKPDTYEIKTIPAGTCDACMGKGTYYAFELYEYHSETGGYVRVWE